MVEIICYVKSVVESRGIRCVRAIGEAIGDSFSGILQKVSSYSCPRLVGRTTRGPGKTYVPLQRIQ